MSAVFRILFWQLIGLFAFVLSLLVHVQTPLARVLCRDAINQFVSEQISGSLLVASVEKLSLSELVAAKAYVLDADGKAVIYAERARIVFDWLPLLKGELHFASGSADRGWIRLEDDRSLARIPTMISAFIPPPSEDSLPGPPPIRARVERMSVHNFTIFGEALGQRGLKLKNVEALWRLEAYSEVRVHVARFDADLVAPYAKVARLHHVGADISSDLSRGVHAWARLRTAEETVDFSLRYRKAGVASDHVDLRLHGEHFDLSDLASLGVPHTAALRGTLSFDARVLGPSDAMQIRGRAHGRGGALRAELLLDKQALRSLTLEVEQLAVAHWRPDLPDLQFSGQAQMVAQRDGGFQWKLHAPRLNWRAMPVGRLSASGRYAGGQVELSRSELRMAEGYLRASGEVRSDLDYRLQLELADAHLQPIGRALPTPTPLPRGGLSGVLTLSGHPDRFPRVSGELRAARLSFGPLQAEQLVLRGSGDAEALNAQPVERLQLSAAQLSLGGFPLKNLRLDSVAGADARSLDVRLAVELRRGARASLSASLQREAGGLIRARIKDLRADLGGQHWRGNSGDIRYAPGESFGLSFFELNAGSQHLEAKGTWRQDGAQGVEVFVDGVSLRELDTYVFESGYGLAGEVSASFSVSGRGRALQLQGRGELQEGEALGTRGFGLAFYTTLAKGTVTFDGQFDFGPLGTLFINSEVLLDLEAADALGQFNDAIYRVQSELVSLDLAVLSRFVRPLAELDLREGRVSGRFDMEGPLIAPDFEGHLSIAGLILPEIPPLDTRLDLDYRQGRFSGSTSLRDPQGLLLELEGSVLADVVMLARDPSVLTSLLEIVPWRLAAYVPTRKGTALPQRVRAYVPEALKGIAFGGKVALRSATLGPMGSARLFFDFPDAEHFGCENSSLPLRLQATLAYARSRVRLAMRAFAGRREVSELETAFALDLFGSKAVFVAPDQLSLRFADFPIADLPIICRYVRGSMSGTANLVDLTSAVPQGRVELRGKAITLLGERGVRLDDDGLRLALSTEAEASFVANLRAAQVDATGTMRWPAHNAGLSLGAQIQLAPTEGDYPTLSATAAQHLRLVLGSVPIAGLEILVPGIDRVGGTVTGTIKLDGPVDALRPTGNLAIDEGYVQVEALGQQLADLRGRVRIEDRSVHIVELRATDFGGRVRLDGEIGFEDLAAPTTSLHMRFDNFPARREGNLLARVGGTAALVSRFRSDAIEVDADLAGLRIALADEAAQSYQSLELHPEVTVVTERVTALSKESATPMIVSLTAPSALEIKSDTFEATLAMDLRLEVRDDALNAEGLVLLEEGEFFVGAQRFAVERGNVRFAPGDGLDPLVSLVAIHELRSSPGATVTVTVSGRLSDPKVEFSSTESNDPAEIIQLLLAGSRGLRSQAAAGRTLSEQQAGQQAASFLAGITASFLTVVTRRQAGDLLPVFAIESGQEGFRSTRFRAGIQVDSLIPAWLERYVRGVYIEGFYTATNANNDDPYGGYYQTSNAGPLGADSGVLLEVQFPLGLGTDLMFAPPASWGLDLTYEP